MSIYVLIHAGFQGGWAWEKVVPLLAQAGHTALAPDLPGHGADPTPIAEVTLQRYVEAVCALVQAQPTPVILVGNSLGGAVITQVAEHLPDRIQKLVYITAMLPRNGESIGSLSALDTESQVGAGMVMASDQSYITLTPETIRACFLNACTAEVAAQAAARFGRQALAPLGAPVQTTPENFGRVPRAYIYCTADKALAPSLQKQMVANLPCEPVFTLATDHTPAQSAPEALTKLLLQVA